MEAIQIQGISSSGQGVGRLPDGKVVFVEGALPGERVQLKELHKEKKNFVAKLAEIVEACPERQEPPCPLFGSCGGCDLQHASPKMQKSLKETILRDALERIGKMNHPLRPILTPEKTFRYRNKGIFHADSSSGQVHLGFYAKDSHALIPAAECLLFSENVNRLLRFLEEALTNSGRPDHVRKVMIRESSATGELMVVYITLDKHFKAKAIPKTIAEAFPMVSSQWHNALSHPRQNLGPSYHHLAGKERISDAIGHLQYELSPASFFQIHSKAAELLYNAAKELTPWQKDATLLDLYCGIGSIGLHMADKVQHMIGIESVRQAVDDAKENAGANNIPKASFHHAKAEAWLPKWVQEGNHAQHVFLDPPRKGCDPKVLEAIERAEIPVITYISCNPATLARDVRILIDKGYRLEEVQPVDMFPQTSHVELVALMSRVDE